MRLKQPNTKKTYKLIFFIKVNLNNKKFQPFPIDITTSYKKQLNHILKMIEVTPEITGGKKKRTIGKSKKSKRKIKRKTIKKSKK